MSILKTENLVMQFGGLSAVNNLSLDIKEREIVSVIGPNGAGKTTAFNMITGVYTPTQGKVLLNGKDITGRRPDEINKLGIARTFQNIRLFKDETSFYVYTYNGTWSRSNIEVFAYEPHCFYFTDVTDEISISDLEEIPIS